MDSFKAFALPSDGAYLVGVTYALSSWVGSHFGTARTMALNDPSSTRGERSAGLADARLAPLGLFSADPGYHVWFCDADWNVLHEASGTIAGSVGWLQSSAAFPIPAAASLFAGELPHREGTDEICRRYVWAAPDGSAPGWALGDVALVGDWGEAPHDWTVAPDPATCGARLRCSVCGRERAVARPRLAETSAGPALQFTAASRLAVRVPDAVAGAWYTLWTAPTPSGPWTAESASVRATADGPLVFEGVDASSAVRFLRAGLSTAPRAAGERLEQ